MMIDEYLNIPNDTIKDIHNDEYVEHPLDKVIAENLCEEIEHHLNLLSIDRTNLDLVAMESMKVMQDYSRAIYEDDFYKDLIDLMTNGKQTFEKIKILIETHPFTSRKNISNGRTVIIKDTYLEITNEILEKIKLYLSDEI